MVLHLLLLICYDEMYYDAFLHALIIGHVFDISPNWNHDMMGNLLVWLPNALSQPFMYFMTNLRYQRMKEGKKD